MNELFKPNIIKFVLIFFDDILLYRSNWQDHLQHVRVVFQVLQANQLYAKKRKCQFGVAEVIYLGHVVSAAGIDVDQGKIQPVLGWSVPKNLKALWANKIL